MYARLSSDNKLSPADKPCWRTTARFAPAPIPLNPASQFPGKPRSNRPAPP